MATDTEFIAAADAVLAAIGAALDEALESSDADLDWSLNDGILEIDCGAHGKLIVNRHVPNREIWVAARSGGFHFRAQERGWVDTRSRRGARRDADAAVARAGGHHGGSVFLVGRA